MGNFNCKLSEDTIQNFLSSQLIYESYLQEAKVDFQNRWLNPKLEIASLNMFEIIRALGMGSYGSVLLVQHKENKNYYGMKVIDKEKIIKNKQVAHVYNERNILDAIRFPFVIHLVYCFKDNSNLYIVTDFAVGGDMFSRLRKCKHFSERVAVFYASQIALALEYLHLLDIIYRDLKPENIVISKDGYLCLVDFGFAKRTAMTSWTICGTPEYMAPEVILGKGYNKAVDWWSYGILLFEMVAGYPPFYAPSMIEIFEKIIVGVIRYPFKFSGILVHLLNNLLELNLSRRYGNLKDGVVDIKSHEWFKNINWISVYEKKIPAPYIPVCKEPVNNVDEYEEKSICVDCGSEIFKDF